MFDDGRNKTGRRRRAAVVALVLISIIVLIGMASLTVDVGMLYRARAEAQAAADSAAMAGAAMLLDQDRLRGAPDMSDEIGEARARAAQYAALNEIVNEGASLNGNPDNDVTGDIVVGYLANPSDPDEPLDFSDPNLFNTVHVKVRRDSGHSRPIDLFFAGAFGRTTADISATAHAVIRSDIVGFDPDASGTNSAALPFALHRDAWTQLLSGSLTAGDEFGYSEESSSVVSGPDGIHELNIYPGGGGQQLPAGSFGTIDIGASNNSTADLARQILNGISAEDIAALGFPFILGSEGTIVLNGDTGLSAGVSDALQSVTGQTRVLPIFSQVSGQGNNSAFTVTGFVGVRIMYVNLTGPMSEKKVLIQPAFVIDPTALPSHDGSLGDGDFVFRPVELVR